MMTDSETDYNQEKGSADMMTDDEKLGWIEAELWEVERTLLLSIGPDMMETVRESAFRLSALAGLVRTITPASETDPEMDS